MEPEPESELGMATSSSDSDLEVGEEETTKWNADDEAVMTKEVNRDGGDMQRDQRAPAQVQEL
eukprot:COSAG02_NODE_56778_length_283_cov_2.798913_1_plen_62_part_01